ncbi:MAG: NAD(P)H-hydrate dehydratase [Methanobacterium sp.]|uniref:NAD(P)H-hydrate dehydratase n=1 Tax=Methanobacterium sp. TaxID=2164 RepID=UPI003D658C28|nr:NAD(P)H-hydrate dehydratase [Methanobacterium sp.]
MTPKDMMAFDGNAEDLGISKSALMENAGKSVADHIINTLDPCKVTIFAGNGGNGGDGFVIARHLLNNGYSVELLFLGDPSRIKSPETLQNWTAIGNISLGINLLEIKIITDSSALKEVDSPVIIDAMLGTGIKGKIKEPISEAIDLINESKSIKIAVDVPSGLDPLTGEVPDKAVEADFTLTFHKLKNGLKNAKTKYVGNIILYDIGIPAEAETFLGKGDLLRLKNRNMDSHKGHNGIVLVVGGSQDYSGAPALAALSAFKAGVDLVYVACPQSVSQTIRSYSPDLIVNSLSNDLITEDDVDKIVELSKKADSVVIGCGMGIDNETALAINEIISEIKNPMIIDADGLKLVYTDIIKEIKSDIVVTPHSAEFKELFGIEMPPEFEDKVEIVTDVASEHKSTVLLKGVIDIISNGQKTRFNKTGNPGMTVGGTGDCLAGLTGALMAIGHDGFEAACLGAYINGRAGDMATEKYKYHFKASDMIKYIDDAFR